MLKAILWALSMGIVNSLLAYIAGLAGIPRNDFSLSVFLTSLIMLSYHFFMKPFSSLFEIIFFFVFLLALDRFLQRTK